MIGGTIRHHGRSHRSIETAARQLAVHEHDDRSAALPVGEYTIQAVVNVYGTIHP